MSATFLSSGPLYEALLLLVETVFYWNALRSLKDDRFKWPRRCILWGISCQLPSGIGGLIIREALADSSSSDKGGLMGWIMADPHFAMLVFSGIFVAAIMGFVLFAAGFLALGLRIGRVGRRAAELEALAASMRAQLAERGAAFQE